MKKRLIKILVSIILLNYVICVTSFAIGNVNVTNEAYNINTNSLNELNTTNEVSQTNTTNEINENNNISSNDNTVQETSKEDNQNIIDEDIQTSNIENNVEIKESATVVNNKENTKKVMLVNNVWRVVINGEVDYNYTGIGSNENGTWYLENGVLDFKYTGTYTENNITYVIQNNKVMTNLTKVMEIDGKWRMVENGVVNYNYTGIGSNENGTWFVKNGIVTFKETETYFKDDTAYIIENSKVMTIVPKNTTKVMVINNKWRMIQNGIVNYTYNGIGSNENGTWYIKDGTMDFTYTGSYNDQNKTTYIVKNNRVLTEVTKVMEIDGVWRMIQNGVVNYNYTGIGNNENGSWYVKGGTVTFKDTETCFEDDKAYIAENSKVVAVVPKNTTEVMVINNKWRKVENGIVKYDYNGLGTNANGTWYIKNGTMDFTYTGTFVDTDKTTYLVKNNRVLTEITKVMEIDGIWRMVINGVIKYNYNAIGSNEHGRWYLENGQVTFKYTGTYVEANTAFIIENSKVMEIVPENTTKVMLINNKWRMIQNGRVNYTYSGIGTNESGTWYIKDGTMDFTYTGSYTDQNKTTYIVKNNRVLTEVTKVMEVDGVWRMVINGIVKYNYNAIGSNENGRWYVENGQVTFKYTGTYFEANTAFIIENSKVMAIVPENTTEVILVNKTWRMVIKGKVDYNYNGVGSNASGMWVIQKGALDFNFTKDWYQDPEGSIYNVKNGKVREVILNVKHPGTMCIDAPAKGSKHGNDTVNVSGWALSQETGDVIQIYLDDKYVGNAKRTDRPDVFNSPEGNKYGGAAMTPKPGFEYKLNIAGLSRGTHIIKVVNLSNDKKSIITSREIPITIIKLAKGWGIDVSKYQGNIDWNAVRNRGVEFAILRIGYYSTSSKTFIKDEWFDSYYESCRRYGIAVGGYVYSYAYNGAEGKEEAEKCLSVIRGKTFELPIFLDVEDDRLKPIDKTQLTNASIEFCEEIQRNGLRAGVYASKNFFNEHLDTARLEKYNIWLAHYTASTDYTGKYDIWQYTSNGSIPGINGPVDLDWCFTRYF